MINIICAVCMPFLIWSVSQRTWRSFDPTVRWIIGITLFIFQFKIQVLTHSWIKFSCYSVLIWTHHPWCCGQVSRSRAAFDMAATATSILILVATAFRWILAATASSRPSRPEFQHSSPTFWLGILAATVVGTSNLRASSAVGNASVVDIDPAAVAVVSSFFITYGKSFVTTFNCSIHNTSKCRTSLLLVHFCLQASFVDWKWHCRRGPKHGRIQWGWGSWHQQRCGAMIELCYMWCMCRKMMIMYCREDYALSLWYISLELQLSLFCFLKLLYVPCFGGSPSGEAAKIGVI
jgi:hypothetical protein